MKFYVGQKVWAIFRSADDFELDEPLVAYGRFAAVITNRSRDVRRGFWNRLLKNCFDWEVFIPDCPNGEHWSMDEECLEPRDEPPEPSVAVSWDRCIWRPSETTA